MPTTISKRVIWEYLNLGGKEHDTWAEFAKHNVYNDEGEDDGGSELDITEEAFTTLKGVALREIVADQYMGENRPGGDTFIEIAGMVQGAVEDGYKLATWYGPQTETLIVGYNPVELEPLEPPEREGEEEREEEDY